MNSYRTLYFLTLSWKKVVATNKILEQGLKNRWILSEEKKTSCLGTLIRQFWVTFWMPLNYKFITQRVVDTSKAWRKIFSFYPKSNFLWHTIVQWKTKIFEQITKERVDHKIYRWNFWSSLKCSCYGFWWTIKISKIHKSGQNWHF